MLYNDSKSIFKGEQVKDDRIPKVNQVLTLLTMLSLMFALFKIELSSKSGTEVESENV